MSRQQLLDSLTAVADDGAITFDDGRYFDFSSTDDDGTTWLEVGDNIEGEGDAVCIEMSHAELLRLHAALTRKLVQMSK